MPFHYKLESEKLQATIALYIDDSLAYDNKQFQQLTNLIEDLSIESTVDDLRTPRHKVARLSQTSADTLPCVNMLSQLLLDNYNYEYKKILKIYIHHVKCNKNIYLRL